MKKVLFLIGSLQGGGAEKVLVDTVNSLDADKYQITVQTLFDDGVYKRKLSNKVRYKTIVTCRQGLLRKIVAKLLFFGMGAKFVYKAFVCDNYDYEIAFLEGLPTKILAKSTHKKAKKIAWVHTDLIENPNSWKAYGSEKKEARAYDSFDKVFCVSKGVEQAFLHKYPMVRARVATLYNIIDDAAIIEASKDSVEMPTVIRPCFISVGRLVEQKGYDRLLRIHKRLIDEGYMHSLLIVGEGHLRAEFEKYIADNNLQDSVWLLGFQSNPYKFIKNADAFVCSSYAEGFSTVITESVLCGTPVIATDVSGNREPIEVPRCSMVVENSEAALYEGLREVVINPVRLKEFVLKLPEKQAWLGRKQLVQIFEKTVFED